MDVNHSSFPGNAASPEQSRLSFTNCRISSCLPNSFSQKLILPEGIFRGVLEKSTDCSGGREVLQGKLSPYTAVPVVCNKCRRNHNFFYRFSAFLHFSSLPYSESEVKQVIKTEGTFLLPGVHLSGVGQTFPVTHSRKRFELFSKRGSPRGRLIPPNIWRNLSQCLTMYLKGLRVLLA